MRCISIRMASPVSLTRSLIIFGWPLFLLGPCVLAVAAADAPAVPSASADPASEEAAEASPFDQAPGEETAATEPSAEPDPATATPAADDTSSPPDDPTVSEGEVPATGSPTEAPAAAAAPDFTRLIQPAVADLLNLTAAQRAKINELTTARDKALAQAAEAERPSVIRASDKTLAALLTEEQLAELTKLKPEPKLRLNFRYQLWADVLQWLAEQADLSLVMDAPPPATFNYTDAHEYTPTEVVDLLNGVLLTKNYTLIRRGRMLLVIDLADGLPEGLVPEVTLEELAKPGIRGKFELVSMIIPLGRRPAETVHNEIKLLLGPHGKVVPLPATAQLKVTDTAGVMRAINAVIQSIAETPIPPVAPEPVEPPPPELKTYTITPLDAERAKEAVTQFAPGAQIVPNDNTEEIIVHTTPSEHAMIEKVLEQMKASNSGDNQSRLETYPVAETLAEAVLTTVTTVVPEANVSLNPVAGKLVVWATADDHEKIVETIAKLNGEGTPATTRQLQIYPLTRVDPDEALALLETILPDGRLAVDKQTRSLIAVAVPADHEVIRRTLAQLQPDQPNPSIPDLRYYPLPMPVPETVVTVLKRKTPGATIVLDPSGEQLMVVATAEEHELIKATVGQIVQATFAKQKNMLKIYAVSMAQRRRFEAILTTLRSQLPGIRVITDAEPGELAIWAKEQQHEVIVGILEELRRDVPNEEKYQLVGYTITASDPSSVLVVLQEMFPDTRLVLDEKSNRLLAWTRPAEHETIKASIEQLQSDDTSPNALVLHVYPYPYSAGQVPTPSIKSSLSRRKLAPPAPSDSLISALQLLVPDAKFTLDAAAERLIVVATSADHDLIQQTLDQVAVDLPPVEEPQFEVYRLRGTVSSTLVASLQPLIPDAQISIGEKNESLIVWAMPDEHKKLMAALAKLKQGGSIDGDRKLNVYRLTKADPAAALTLLQELLPDAQLSVDAATNSLIALATAADHKVIADTIKGLEPEGLDPNAPELAFYTLAKAPPESLLAVLKNVAPKAQIELGADKKHLTVVATPADQAVIKSIVEKVDETAPEETQNQLEVYRLTKADPTSTLKLLGELLPDAQITLDSATNSLVAVAVADDQKAIKALLSQLQPDGPDPMGPQLRFYPLKAKAPSTLTTLLKGLAPKAQVTLDTDGRRLTVVATADDHQLIEATIQQIELASPGEPELRFYPLVDTPPPSLLTALKDLIPGAKITLEAEDKRLMVVATAVEHERLKTTLDKILSTLPPEEKNQLAVYPVTNAQQKRFEAILSTLTADLPGVKVLDDGQSGQLTVWAKPTQHIVIAGMIEKLRGEVDASQKLQFMSYQLDSADPQSVMDVMTTLFPDVKTVMDEKAARLSVWATAEEQGVIGQAIEQMDTGTPVDREEKIIVYPMPEADLTVAVGVLEELFTRATFHSDTTAGTIIARASQSDQEGIKKLVEQLQGENGPENRPRIEVYPIGGIDPDKAEKLVETLQPMVEDAQLRVDPTGTKLVAWAKPDQHETIKTTIEKLGHGGVVIGTRAVEVYQLTRASPETVETLLKTLVPGARVTVDKEARRLVVMANTAEHATIKATLSQLQPEQTGPNAPVLKVYPYPYDEKDPSLPDWLERIRQRYQDRYPESPRSAPASTLSDTLKQLVPDAQLTIDRNGKRLLALASPTDQETIKMALEQIESAGPGEPELRYYDLTRTATDSLVKGLQSMAPDAQVSLEDDGRRLMVVATAEDHALVQATVEKLAATGSDDPQMQIYELKDGAPEGLITGLGQLVPKAQVSLDTTGKQLIAIATANDHTLIKAAVDKLDAVGPGEPQLQTYDLKQAAPADLVAGLAQLVPQAQVTLSADGKRLMAIATPEDQKTIAAAVSQAANLGPGDPELRFYALKQAPPADLVTGLQTLAPNAQITLETSGKRLMVVGSPEDHAAVKANLEKAEQSVSTEPQLQFHPLSQTPPASLLTALSMLAPDAQVTLEADENRLMVIASPDDHALIKATIERVEKTLPPEEKPRLATYSVTPAQRKRFEALLTEITADMPAVKLIADAEPGQLSIWAKPTQHIVLVGILEQLKRDVPPEKQYKLVAYAINSADPASVLTVMQSLFPNMQIVLDAKARRLAVWTSPEEHTAVKAAMDELDRDEGGDSRETLVAYPISKADPAVAIEMLQELLPDVKLNNDTTAGTIVAWARQRDHEVIAKTIEKMEVGPDAAHRPTITVYPCGEGDPTSMQTMLTTLVPEATVTIDADKNALVALATPEDHQTMATAIKKMTEEGTAGGKRTVEVYNLEKAPAAGIVLAMRGLVPGAHCAVGADPQQLIAWARPADHLRIQDVIAKIQDEGPAENRPSLVVYSLKAATAVDAMPIITTAVPNAQLNAGTLPNQILAWAKPADHTKIEETIAKLDQEEPAETAPRAVVYSLEETSSTRAVYKLQLIRAAVPTADFTLGSDPNNLIAWARPTEHEKIKQIITELTSKGPVESRPTVFIYTLKSTTAAAAASVLGQMVPNAEITVGEDPSQLIALARPVDHEDIKTALKQIDVEEPPETAPRMVIYTLKTVTAADALGVLTTAVPNARINEGSIANQLFAWARPDDHKKIEASIAQIDAEEPEETAPRAVIYSLEETSSTQAYYKLRLLREVVPTAEFTLGADPSNLIAWARPAEHEKIAELVEQLVSKGPDDKRPTMVVYTLKSISATTAIRVLGPAAPGAELEEGDDPSQMIAWARPSDHEEIKTALAKIDIEEPPETAAQLVIYTLQTTTADDAETVLQTAAPNATISAGTIPNQLFIWARPDDHKKIEATIAKLDAKEPEETAPRAVLYTLEGSTSRTGAIYRLRLLQEMAPSASMTFGADTTQLIVWARPADHEKIKEVVEQFGAKGPPEKRPSLVIYTLKSTTATAAISVLTSAVPEAELTAGNDPSQLVAWARPADHDEIKTVLEKFDVTEPPETAVAMQIHTLTTMTAAEAMPVLTMAVPHARITLGAQADQLIVWARPDDHKKLKETIDKLETEPDETAPTIAIYTLKATTATDALAALTPIVPNARLTAGADPSQLIAWARPAEHQKIEETLKTVDSEGDAPSLVVYPLNSVAVETAIAALGTVVPGASLTPGAEPNQLLAFARPADHEKIKESIAKIDQTAPSETAAKVVVYPLESGTAAGAMTFLVTAFPQAKITAGANPRQIIVWARPAEHEKIKAAIDEMSQKEAAATAPTVKTYSVEVNGAGKVILLLSTAVPDAQLSVGANASQLIAFAAPGDHEVIEKAIEQIEAGGLRDTGRVLTTYALRAEDVPSLMQVLDPALTQNAQFVTDPNRDMLIVWATPKYQEAINNAVEEFQKKMPEPVEPVAKVYRFEDADPAAALAVLTALVPAAEIALDEATGNLVVSALPDDHEKIQTMIDEMDRKDAGGQAPTLQIYPLVSVDPLSVLPALQGLFGTNSRIQLSLDQRNDALIAVATPKDHERIKELLAKVEEGALTDTQSTLQLYPLKDIDSYSAMEILETVLQKQGVKADLSIDSGTNQLVAIARPAQHETIKSMLEKLRQEERTMEILQLDFLEPNTADLAISRLFSDEGFSNQPDVSSDLDTGQLFIRATKEQHQEIRALLIKLGETELKTLGAGTDSRLRVIPFAGDAKSAVEEIQRVWPQLRDNPIRVVAPSSVNTLLPEKTPESGPKGEAGKPGKAGPAAEGEAPTEPDDSVKDDDVTDEPTSPAPVLVMLGDGTITLASEDSEALDQFESLLRSMSQRAGFAGRDFSIYAIRHASAAGIADTLSQLFRNKMRSSSSSSTYRYRTTSRLVIVPDERLNTILVQGSRADRAKIENLLKVLDTSEVPEMLAANKPKLIPIHNTQATRIERVIRDMFDSQLSSREDDSLPSWLSSEMSVDEVTNSLVVMAPSPLIDEITDLAERLDKAAGDDPARELKIIALKKINAVRAVEALESIRRGGTSGSSRSRYRSSPR